MPNRRHDRHQDDGRRYGNTQISGSRGLLSNLYVQMKDQNMEDRFSDVLKEIPKVREDLGEPPLVTPSSQIVGTQAVFNIMTGERYKMVSKQTESHPQGRVRAGQIRPFNKAIQKKVLDGEELSTAERQIYLHRNSSTRRRSSETRRRQKRYCWHIYCSRSPQKRFSGSRSSDFRAAE